MQVKYILCLLPMAEIMLHRDDYTFPGANHSFWDTVVKINVPAYEIILNAMHTHTTTTPPPLPPYTHQWAVTGSWDGTDPGWHLDPDSDQPSGMAGKENVPEWQTSRMTPQAPGRRRWTQIWPGETEVKGQTYIFIRQFCFRSGANELTLDPEEANLSMTLGDRG